MEDIIQRKVKRERLSLSPVCEGLRVGVNKGGLSIKDNLQSSCNNCNLKKGSSMIF